MADIPFNELPIEDALVLRRQQRGYSAREAKLLRAANEECWVLPPTREDLLERNDRRKPLTTPPSKM